MGPTILLDKSALQRLSADEAFRLDMHYNVNIAPVLIVEILADLKKDTNKTIKTPEDEVRILANKVSGLSYINAHYREVLIGSLMGRPDPIVGQIPMSGGVPITDATGKRSVFFDEPPEKEAIRRWQQSQFTEAERLLAERWRGSTRKIDLEGFRNQLRKMHAKLPSIASLADLSAIIDDLLKVPSYQRFYLEWCMQEAGVPKSRREAILRRWVNGRFGSLQTFSGYGYFIFRVILMFHLALILGLIGTRPTNRIDLEYLYYLPFSHAFSSGDAFQRDFGRVLFLGDQDFIEADDLKQDMKNIQSHWDALGDNERTKWREEYGDYPPENDASPTYRLWKKHMRPRSERKPIKLTEENNKRIMEHLRPQLDAIREYEKTREAEKDRSG